MSRCPKCHGNMIPDLGGASCLQCGRVVYFPRADRELAGEPRTHYGAPATAPESEAARTWARRHRRLSCPS